MKSGKLKKKTRSKKGLTLVEILIGVSIVVIVFSSTLGAMVGGFTTTVNNSDQNRAAILNSSLNEIIMNTVIKMQITEDSADDRMMDIESGDPALSPILAAVSAAVPEAKYVPATVDGSGNPTVAFAEGVDYQYTLLPGTDLPIDTGAGGATTNSVKGIAIKTRFESADGGLIYESFVPYYV